MFGKVQKGGQSLAPLNINKMLVGPAVVPTPMPNVAMSPMAVGAVPNVLVDGTPAHNLGTVVPLSMGDSAGTLGGVVSGTLMAVSRDITGAFTVLIGGKPASRVTSMSIQNLMNAQGITLAPGQTKLLILSA